MMKFVCPTRNIKLSQMLIGFRAPHGQIVKYRYVIGANVSNMKYNTNTIQLQVIKV